ncbi:tRNA-dihydrouridine(20a/20b) synthase [NAD(P)+]-like isoform X5 [Ranitomeya imitator]|uniref:tRNA-dihydrouridine(20a/20b) synthase [NAD(P)+]-like isoform X5 n=1 Tax=Ranitomeya imitator TaxID=111125 RepID=UPI0037E6F99B
MCDEMQYTVTIAAPGAVSWRASTGEGPGHGVTAAAARVTASSAAMLPQQGDNPICLPQDPAELFSSNNLVKICAPMVRYSKWAMAEGYGACLINQPQLVSDMVKQVRSQVENKRFSISIKIRIHADIARTVDLCRKAEAAGVSWITVHGRLCEERHQPVHYDAIKIIKDSLSIPVVANGDIKSLKEAESIHQKTGADGVMAARGLLANPAMFAGYEETPMACIQDWIDIALEHGTPFTCFHHHLMYMMEKITSKQEKRVFNVLSSTSAVLDYLRDSYGV